MITPKYMGALAVAAVLATSSAAAGALSTGVCYSPWHHDSVTTDIVQKDFAQIKTYFSGVRTYHASFSGLNVIDEAAKAGVKVAVGIQMSDASKIQSEISAACEGAKRNPNSVEAIYVGNENLKNGDFGTFSGSELAGYITQLKTCISNGSIKIGSVQRINEWISASDAAALAAASDVMGVNIYPFFTQSTKTPIERLTDQWKEINDKYPGGKVHITETGWPRAGSTQVSGNAPSKEIATSFLKDYANWAKSQPTSYWFMMYDTKGNTPDYENYFGLADTSGVVQLEIPTGDGSATPAATPASTGTTPAATPAAPAAATAAPAATTAAPAAATAAPAATTAAPAATAAAPAATTAAPAATTAAPANNGSSAKQTDVTTTPAPKATPAATTPTAAAGSTGSNGKKPDCAA
ncbi:hypothetical protein Gpo141_00012920 [Globisporangium polare]